MGNPLGLIAFGCRSEIDGVILALEHVGGRELPLRSTGAGRGAARFSKAGRSPWWRASKPVDRMISTRDGTVMGVVSQTIAVACPQRARAVLLYAHKGNDIGLGSPGARLHRAPPPRHRGLA